MHNLKYRSWLVIAATMMSFLDVIAQDNKKDNDVRSHETQQLVQSKDFVFIAQNASPMGGRTINLTSLYNVTLSADTIATDLPYFGRSFVAPINPSQGGIRFSSTDFTYSTTERKKGGWDITILPKDTRDVRQMFLTISEKGYASLQVTSNNRQTISFYGYITSRNKLR